MATGPSSSDAAAEVRNLNRALSSAATEAARLARTTRKLEQSMESASNGAIDKASEALTELAKQSSILEDTVKDNIKANKLAPKELAKVIDRIEKQGDLLISAQKKYKDSLTKIRESQVAAHRAAAGNKAAERKAKADALRAERAATRALKDQLTRLGISAHNAAGRIDSLSAEAKAFKASVSKVATDLSKPSAQLSKVFDLHKSKLQDSIAKYSKFGAVVGLTTKALTSLYEQSIRLANKGLVGSMHQINMSAIKLRLSAEEFEAVISENRDLVNTMGGGAAGVEKFEAYLKSSSAGLEYLGKNAYGVITQYTKAFTNVGMGPYGAMADNFKKLIPSLNKQFKLLHGAFGDTAEQFGAYYETILSAESIQLKLNAGMTKEVALQVQEIMARTANLRLMGATNQELESMTKRVEATFNLKRNEQGESQSQRLYAQQGFKALAQEILAGGGYDDAAKAKADAVYRFITSGGMARQQNMSPESKARFNDENRKLMQDIADLPNIVAARKEQTGGRGSFSGFLGNDLLPKGGAESDYFTGIGGTLKAIQNRNGLVNAPEEEIAKRATAAFANALSNASGETTEFGKGFGLLRSTVELVSAVLNNPFSTSLMAASAAAMWLATSLAGPAMMKSLSTLASVGGGGKLGLLKSLGAATGAGAAGYAIGTGISKLIEGTAFNDWIGETIAKGVSKIPIFGADAKEAIELAAKNKNNDRKSSGRVTQPPNAVTSQSSNAALSNNPQLATYLAGVAKLETQNGVKSIKGPGGVDSHNLYNIKDFSGGGFKAFDKAERSNDAYRVYNSREESTADMINLLKRKYPGAIDAKTPEEFAMALKKGGYATDPNYVAKLTNIINSSRSVGSPPLSVQAGASIVQPQIPVTAAGAAPTVEQQRSLAQASSVAAAQRTSYSNTLVDKSSSGSVVDELQKHTSLLNTMVTLLGRTEASKRPYQLDQQTALNVVN